jgi:hypothetical protein
MIQLKIFKFGGAVLAFFWAHVRINGDTLFAHHHSVIRGRILHEPLFDQVQVSRCDLLPATLPGVLASVLAAILTAFAPQFSIRAWHYAP